MNTNLTDHRIIAAEQFAIIIIPAELSRHLRAVYATLSAAHPQFYTTYDAWLIERLKDAAYGCDPYPWPGDEDRIGQ